MDEFRVRPRLTQIMFVLIRQGAFFLRLVGKMPQPSVTTHFGEV